MKYIIAVLLVLFASYADLFLYRINIVPYEPSRFLIPLFFVLCILKYSIKDFIDLIKTHTFKILFAILILNIIYVPVSPADREIITNKIALNVISVLIYIFALHFFRTEDKKLVVAVLSLSFIVLAGSLWYDFFIGLPKYNIKLAEAVRKGGFGENPNQAASGIKFLSLGILVFLQKQKSIKILFIFTMVISVFLTFSRGGIISVVLILLFGSANNWYANFQISILGLFKSFLKMAFLFTAIYLILVLFVGVIKENFPSFTRGEAGERIDLLIGKSDESIVSEETGSGGRSELLYKFFNEFKSNPLGYGTGYGSDKRFHNLNSHNYYLSIGVDLGFIAVILYLIYLFYSLKLSLEKDHFYYFIFVILLLFEGFLSHRIFDERAILISLAFFDSLIYKKQTSRQPVYNKYI